MVIERATGSVQVVDNDARTSLARIEGLGDLSHASVVFSRDGRHAYVFGRDGGLTKVDLLTQRIERRVMQAGSSIGEAISTNGRVVAAQSTSRAASSSSMPTRWSCWPTFPRAARTARPPRWWGWPICRASAAFSLFDAGEIWVVDAAPTPASPR